MLKATVKIATILIVLVMLSLGVSAQDVNLSIVWFAWPPCDLLASLVQDYPDANVTVSCVPLD